MSKEADKKAQSLAYRPIEVKGCRVNNLKNISVEIPRGKLTVVTGVSGSGKSSLAFDTLYAEGQRRYVESLSSYARQFLDRMPKPDCDSIKYIPPAVAIRQGVISRNPRSTVATATELYDYLKLLFARFGTTLSPISGQEVKRHTVQDVVKHALEYEEGTHLLVVAPLKRDSTLSVERQLSVLQAAGYSRLLVNDSLCRMSEVVDWQPDDEVWLVIDRLSVRHDNEEFTSRLADSAELAFYEGKSALQLVVEKEKKAVRRDDFSNRFEADGITFEEPTTALFDFNNPMGACPTCEGFGKTIGLSEELIVPYPSLSVYDDAVACWIGPKSAEWKRYFIASVASLGFRVHTPYQELNEREKELLWNGKEGIGERKEVYGINDYFAMLRKEYYKIQNRVRLAHFSGRCICPTCKGRRLKKEAYYVKIGGKDIGEVVDMTIAEAKLFFDTLTLPEGLEQAADRILTEIRTRLSVVAEIGLSYLQLSRAANTLSGGESQRINLATRLGNNLYGAMYVLDEPTIGLHDRDTEQLVHVIEELREAGNTLIVVEHDEMVMRAADYIVDIGPNAGRYGGEVVFAGSPNQITSTTPGYTAAFLTGKEKIPVPPIRRKWRNAIQISGACKHNLKNVSVKFPLDVITVVTGVSGSGKSTLVRDVLYQETLRYLDRREGAPLGREELQQGAKQKILGGDISHIQAAIYVDQNNAGRTTRSNPVTYMGAYDAIRELYAEQPLSKQMGYQPYFFSFNRPGGRCEECKGEGTVTIEMQFMADLTLICSECDGKRFKKEILDVTYAGVNIFELLEMSVNQAVDFFTKHSSALQSGSIVAILKVLQRVGLGYIKLGQSTSTLSGGENQRLKLAYYLSKTRSEPTLFFFDEPTTGLHFHDISRLMECFDALVEAGHTVVIIEHNMEVIKCADWIIDLGPEGGAEGGYIVAEGTPEAVALCPDSYTARFLKEKLSEAN